MKNTGINLEKVRIRNRASVLSCIRSKGEVSRKEIAELTGLTPASVTQICGDLLEEGLLKEAGIDDTAKGAGRRKIMLKIDPAFGTILSVNIEAEKTVISLDDLNGDPVGGQAAIRRLSTEPKSDPLRFLDKVAEVCKELTRWLKEPPLGVSVGVVGQVDRERGVSTHAYGIWDSEVPVAAFLEKRLGIPCLVENNVNAFALAEVTFGAGRSHDDLLIVKWGPGVGCALIIRGALYDGRRGRAGELGHVIVEPGGKPCPCGRRGCLETRISSRALAGLDCVPDDALNLFARTLVNTITVCAPNKVLLYGPFFKDTALKDRFLRACLEMDGTLDGERILETELADRVEHIGPTAVFLRRRIFGME